MDLMAQVVMKNLKEIASHTSCDHCYFLPLFTFYIVASHDCHHKLLPDLVGKTVRFH